MNLRWVLIQSRSPKRGTNQCTEPRRGCRGLHECGVKQRTPGQPIVTEIEPQGGGLKEEEPALRAELPRPTRTFAGGMRREMMERRFTLVDTPRFFDESRDVKCEPSESLGGHSECDVGGIALEVSFMGLTAYREGARDP